MRRILWLLAAAIECVATAAMLVQDKPTLAVLFGLATVFMLTAGRSKD